MPQHERAGTIRRPGPWTPMSDSRLSGCADSASGTTHTRLGWHTRGIGTAGGPQKGETAWESQPNPYSPIGSFSGNSREHAGRSAKTLGPRGRLFSPVPGCSRRAGPHTDRTKGAAVRLRMASRRGRQEPSTARRFVQISTTAAGRVLSRLLLSSECAPRPACSVDPKGAT